MPSVHAKHRCVQSIDLIPTPWGTKEVGGFLLFRNNAQRVRGPIFYRKYNEIKNIVFNVLLPVDLKEKSRNKNWARSVKKNLISAYNRRFHTPDIFSENLWSSYQILVEIKWQVWPKMIEFLPIKHSRFHHFLQNVCIIWQEHFAKNVCNNIWLRFIVLPLLNVGSIMYWHLKPLYTIGNYPIAKWQNLKVKSYLVWSS